MESGSDRDTTRDGGIVLEDAGDVDGADVEDGTVDCSVTLEFVVVVVEVVEIADAAGEMEAEFAGTREAGSGRVANRLVSRFIS